MDTLALKLEDHVLGQRVSQCLASLMVSREKMLQLRDVFEGQLEIGMNQGLDGSSLQMENTYVPELLNGSEEGTYLALDLGGTNFRVILLEMEGGKIAREQVRYYSVPEEKRLGKGDALFVFLAECIYDFAASMGLADQERTLPLGFTFSFPMTQTALDEGVLVAWTKSFNCPGVVGENVVEMLRSALALTKSNHHKLVIEVVAILNDTTGTLVKGAYDRARTCIGLILGTGCNGAYFERSENVIRWHGGKYLCENVIIDPEFGAFGDDGCIQFMKTKYDQLVDDASLLPGSFTYEKYFAGKYIGEIAREIFLDLHQQRLLLVSQDLSPLSQANAFTAKDVTELVEDVVAGTEDKTMAIFQAFGLQCSPDDLHVLQHVATILSERTALMVAVPLAVFLARMKTPQGDIAVTGSLYQCHPTLRVRLEKFIQDLYPEWQGQTFLSEDGSGKGAGLIAAIAQRMKANCDPQA